MVRAVVCCGSLPPDMESGAVGLVLSYALTLIGMFQWGARQSAEVENMVRSPNMLGSLLTWYSLS